MQPFLLAAALLSALSAAQPIAPTEVRLSAGRFHTCFILPSNASILCWGACGSGACAVPVVAEGFVSVSAGDDFTCAVTGARAVVCWGANQLGQASPPASAQSQAAGLFTGESYACALSFSGALACWGGGIPFYPSSGVTLVATGFAHICATTAAGGTACAGDGGGGNTNTYGMDDVPALANATAISVGRYHSCALSAAGLATCWGYNGDHQSEVPDGTFASISAGERHTCGVLTNGVVRCWGAANYNDCQSENFIVCGQATVPTAVSASRVVAVTAGFVHSCALDATGGVSCWGCGDPRDSGQCTVPTQLVSASVSPSSTASSSATLSPTSSPSFSATATPGLACPPALFRPLPRSDLLGAPLTDEPLAVTSEGACRIACCGAPGCGGYAFASNELRWTPTASCFLLANVTNAVSANLMTSGLLLPGPAPPTRPCAPSLFRALPRMDLGGTLVGSDLAPGDRQLLLPSEAACRQACCSAPACDGFSFATSELGFVGSLAAGCFLYVNITQLIPSSGYSSGIVESTL